MKVYQVLNADFMPVPAKPFPTESDAVRHIKALQESYNQLFHVIEWNIVSSVLPPRTDQ